MVILDCNDVLADSEPIAAAVLADAFKRVGMALTVESMMRRFQGRRPADIFAAVEAAIQVAAVRFLVDGGGGNAAPAALPNSA